MWSIYIKWVNKKFSGQPVQKINRYWSRFLNPFKFNVDINLTPHDLFHNLKPNGLNLSCDKYIKVLNKLMECKDLRANPSQEGVLHTKQVPDTKVLQHVISSK